MMPISRWTGALAIAALAVAGDTAYVAQFAPGVNAIKILRTNPMQVIGEVQETEGRAAEAHTPGCH